MIKAIKEQFGDAVLAEAAARYGVTPDQLKNLGGFESFVYEFAKEGQSYILKITHTIRRSEEYIMGELDWLNFLADHGVSVARAVPSTSGRLIEHIPAADGGAWLVMAYTKAPGHRVTADEWNEEFFAAWGRLIGQMHRVTKTYKLANPAYKRQEWFEEDQLNARKYLPDHEAGVIARTEAMIAALRALRTPLDAYGMLHTDLHHGNLFVENGQITAFDFDDCSHNWFAADIAYLLLGALWFPPKPYEDRAVFAQAFLTAFFRGYNQENRLDPQWLPLIRESLLLRDALQFITVYQVADVTTFNEEQLARLDEHRQRVLQGRAFVELDWTQFAEV